MRNLIEKHNGKGISRDHASEYEINYAQKLSKKNYPLSNSQYIYWIETDTGNGGLSSIIQYNFEDSHSINLTGNEFNVKSKIHE